MMFFYVEEKRREETRSVEGNALQFWPLLDFDFKFKCPLFT